MTSGAKRLLVTGGSGFIGSEVVNIATRSFVVQNIDMNPPNFPEHEPFWAKTDVRDKDAVMDRVKSFSPDYILHLASDVDINLSSLAAYETTIGGTQNIIDAAKSLSNLMRFVHISTQYVVRPGVEPLNDRFLLPYTLYGQAKAEAEKRVWTSDLPSWYILRPTIIWGPRHPSFANQIWKYMASRQYLHPASRQPIMRTYGYVTNVAQQMVNFVDQDEIHGFGRTFYLGDSCLNYDYWADAFSRELTGKPARRVPTYALKALGIVGEAGKRVGIKSPFDLGRYERMTTPSPLDLAPTFSVVGVPTVPFEQGLRETVEWLRETDPQRYLPRP